jgi:isoleucyl-tRNA synthetase
LRALEQGEAVECAVDGRTFAYRPEDVVVEREVRTDWLVQSDGPYVAALDPGLSEELRREGLAREVINRVQRLRKEAGYDYNTRIELSISGADEVVRAAEAFRDIIGGETLARRVEVGRDIVDPDGSETVDIDGRVIVLAVRRTAH